MSWARLAEWWWAFLSRPLSASRLVPALSCFVALAGCSEHTVDAYDLSITDLTPRLENGERERRGPVINEAAFNKAAVAGTIAPYAGFIGDLRVDYIADRTQIQGDLRELGQVAPPDFNPNERVTIDFTDASLNFVLEQLLSGALGVNYVAPRNLPTGIDFRTATPLPKSRVLQVVRDLLARNNLVMRFINGVYHIGTPDVIEALQVNSAAGRQGDEISRIVKLGRGNGQRVVDLAAQLLPQNVSVMLSSSPDTVVVRANPGDMASVERMLLALSDTAVGSQRVAIVPLKRSAPEAVAQQLTDFYAPSLREGEGTVTVVPLSNQQAILVGTTDAGLMRGVVQLAEQLDRSVTDRSELRIIALTHLKAVDIVSQLSQLFGSTVTQQPAAEEAPAAPRTGVRARLRPAELPRVDDNEDGTGLAVPPPAPAPPAEGEGGGNGEGERGFAASATPAPAAGETRIVADPRTNSILVYSTYTVYKRMRELLQTLDVAQAQVVIEATVLEVELNDNLETGVAFFLQSNGIVVGSGIPAGNQAPSIGGIVGVGTTIGDVTVDAVLRALREVTKLKVVSSPYLTVVDGQSAKLVIGDQIPFASTSQTSNNQGNVTVTQEIDILDTGVVLEITPVIHANNSVSLNIIQSVSKPVAGTEDNDLTPTISTRDISSQILAQSGRTILLGGMIQDRAEGTQTGVPKLAEVPVIGSLFRRNRTDAIRTELIVLITPRVVRSSTEIEGITRLLQGVTNPVSRTDLKAPY